MYVAALPGLCSGYQQAQGPRCSCCLWSVWCQQDHDSTFCSCSEVRHVLVVVFRLAVPTVLVCLWLALPARHVCCAQRGFGAGGWVNYWGISRRHARIAGYSGGNHHPCHCYHGGCIHLLMGLPASIEETALPMYTPTFGQPPNCYGSASSVFSCWCCVLGLRRCCHLQAIYASFVPCRRCSLKTALHGEAMLGVLCLSLSQ